LLAGLNSNAYFLVNDSTQRTQQRHFTPWKGADLEFIPRGMALIARGCGFNLFSLVSISYQPGHAHSSC